MNNMVVMWDNYILTKFIENAAADVPAKKNKKYKFRVANASIKKCSEFYHLIGIEMSNQTFK